MKIANKIRIVLINTSHSGNIGSAARAMKTMGLSKLYLAYPEAKVNEQSYALSAGANDVLDSVVVCETLQQALAGCTLVIGASARRRTVEKPLLNPREMGKLVCDALLSVDNLINEIAIVFGCERTGLTNEELSSCNYHVTILSNPEYSSLNLAMAVQVLCYEIRHSYLESLNDGNNEANFNNDNEIIVKNAKDVLASADEVDGMFQHMSQVLIETEFLHKNNRGHIMRKIRRIFTRNFFTKDDINILRGILTSVTRTINRSKS